MERVLDPAHNPLTGRSYLINFINFLHLLTIYSDGEKLQYQHRGRTSKIKMSLWIEDMIQILIKLSTGNTQYPDLKNLAGSATLLNLFSSLTTMASMYVYSVCWKPINPHFWSNGKKMVCKLTDLEWNVIYNGLIVETIKKIGKINWFGRFVQLIEL